MATSTLEESLLSKLSSGVLDGIVGSSLTTSGGSTVWSQIEDGTPTRYKQGPGGKFFDGKENTRYEGVLHTLQTWATDSEKLEFLQKYGWLLDDAEAREYSALYK